jgi:hypothetical protein
VPGFQAKILAAAPGWSWLAPSISESRNIIDTGPTDSSVTDKVKWLDFFLPYIPQNQRPIAYQKKLWKKIVDGGPRVPNLKIQW